MAHTYILPPAFWIPAAVRCTINICETETLNRINIRRGPEIIKFLNYSKRWEIKFLYEESLASGRFYRLITSANVLLVY